MSGSKTGKWKIIWTEPAVHDLSEIAEYIGRDSQYYAARIVQAVYELAENLSTFPLRGRIVPEFGQENLSRLLKKSQTDGLNCKMT
ncbi:MAG: type II toxin-antitoxin system RelE/ParE family toxin, partial [Nitrospinales bacterium]